MQNIKSSIIITIIVVIIIVEHEQLNKVNVVHLQQRPRQYRRVKRTNICRSKAKAQTAVMRHQSGLSSRKPLILCLVVRDEKLTKDLIISIPTKVHQQQQSNHPSNCLSIIFIFSKTTRSIFTYSSSSSSIFNNKNKVTIKFKNSKS